MATGLVDTVLSSLDYRLIGPHRGGRSVAVAGDVSDPMTFYFGACAGGVWKTTDGGVTWRCISDGYFKTSAVGAIAVSTADPNVIYVGTGETSIRGNVSHGDGVYKSTNGGKSWVNCGLADTRHIGKIQIHPRNPEIVYVAALGHAWGQNPDRGVYKSTDGGKSWRLVLHQSARAGSHDISLDPNDPNVIFAAVWQAQRYPHALVNGGADSGLWLSTDAGETWTDITARLPLKQFADGEPPERLLGKIGVVVSPARRDRVWALVEAEDGALFRSDDGGDTWERVNNESKLRTRPWYYMHVTADPVDGDTVYVQNYRLWKSIDGGRTMAQIPTPHGDEHALWIDPQNNRRLIDGNDGGACVSFNGGESWSSIYNQPTAQLYHVITDDATPYRVYASQQDNTALSIPSMSVDGAITERDWIEPGGGESGYIAIKPNDPNIVVASGPVGRRAYNDIMTMYDRRTGQRWNITVWPELYGWGAGSESLKYRLQWTVPILFSRHDPNTLYVASQHVHKSTTLGASWEVVSPDLTRNDPTKLLPSGGPITRDNTGAEVYCTIFALVESPQQAGVLWAGTDDGLVHISRDHGQTWTEITPDNEHGLVAGGETHALPDWALISIVEPSPHDPATCYVAATRYKHDDLRPYLYKTNDFGQTWTMITHGLPEHEFTRVIREDPKRRGLLYAGTETGLYVSFDDGSSWRRLGGNLPVAPIHDCVVKGVELVVATHGRSIWILDDLTPLHQLHDARQTGGVAEAHRLFAPRPSPRIRMYKGLWGDLVPNQTNYGGVGPSKFSVYARKTADGSIKQEYLDAGQNPPPGVTIHYYLASRPTGPVTLAILDAAGNELRAYVGPKDGVGGKLGLNRFLWNRRLLGVSDVTAPDLEPWHRRDGPMVTPGNYQVRLTVDDQAQTRPLVILPDPRITTSAADLAAQFDFLQAVLLKLDQTNDTINDIDRLLAQLAAWQPRLATDANLTDNESAAEEAAVALRRIRGRLIDVNMKQAQLWPSGLHEKFNALFDSVDSADFAPPQQAREVYVKLGAELDSLQSDYFAVINGPLAMFNESLQFAEVDVIA